jgi:hypothetical protein
MRAWIKMRREIQPSHWQSGPPWHLGGWQGIILGQPLMIGLAALGLGAAITFLIALLRPATKPADHVREHLKAMVGAGISAYTAFLSVGLLQIVPDHVFNPAIWAIPSAVGVG